MCHRYFLKDLLSFAAFFSFSSFRPSLIFLTFRYISSYLMESIVQARMAAFFPASRPTVATGDTLRHLYDREEGVYALEGSTTCRDAYDGQGRV